MSSLVSDYQNAVQLFTKSVSNIGSDQWSLPTPCSEWNVRQLVNHLVSEMLWLPDMFAGKTISEVGDKYEGDLLEDNPIAAVEDAAGVAIDTVSNPSALETICHLSFGDAPGSVYIGQMMFDVIIHGWDLNKATGQDTSIDDHYLDAIGQMVYPNIVQFAPSKYFAGPIPVDESADKQTKLLAALGRTA